MLAAWSTGVAFFLCVFASSAKGIVAGRMKEGAR